MSASDSVGLWEVLLACLCETRDYLVLFGSALNLKFCEAEFFSSRYCTSPVNIFTVDSFLADGIYIVLGCDLRSALAVSSDALSSNTPCSVSAVPSNALPATPLVVL